MADVLFFPAAVRPPFKVYDSDPLNPPEPPEGARAVEVRDADGHLISYSWVAPVIGEDIILTRAWNWADELWPLIALSMLASGRPLARGV